jgi:polysaccharide export outer membrane protein
MKPSLLSALVLLVTVPLPLWGEPPSAGAAGEKVPGNLGSSSPVSWRKRFELGPGDVINLSLFGRPELDRPGFRVAPDGTISYLQAQNVKVDGLTIDEARLAVEKGLAPHFRSPRVIIVPQEVASKRYTILGKVINRGVATLDRPITLVEAIANAGGLETGLFEERTIELADLDRSFVSRNGKRLSVDFRRLLQESDMKQNIEIEPGDYIYVASNISNDYYVLGAVESPGVQGLTPDASVVAAITRRKGFTARAWTERVLVVRGSLANPKVHVVNMKKVLAAQEQDFKLQPKDIVYVADHPWAEAEDILQAALSAFVTSAASSWVNVHATP